MCVSIENCEPVDGSLKQYDRALYAPSIRVIVPVPVKAGPTALALLFAVSLHYISALYN